MLDQPCTQATFGALIGVSQQAVSELMAKKIITQGEPARVWLLSYCAHMREVAAGRDSDGMLVTARTALAIEQTQAIALKNAVTRKEYAPVGLLADVLATASAGVVDRFDALPGELRKVCPDLPVEARDTIGRTIAAARNEWIRATAELAVARLEQLTAPPAEDEAELVQP